MSLGTRISQALHPASSKVATRTSLDVLQTLDTATAVAEELVRTDMVPATCHEAAQAFVAVTERKPSHADMVQVRQFLATFGWDVK